MRWEKKGLIYCENKSSEWRYQWAILPTPILISSDTLRIYVGFCDKDIVGRIGYVDVLPNNPSKIKNISDKPVVDIGRDGCFDDNGVVPISVLRVNGAIRLYYIGFCKGVKVPYYMFCGLAVSEDNGNTFKKYSECPILDRSGDETYARCGVNIIKDNDNYRMWYIGSYGQGWTLSSGKLKPLYIMKTTISRDGINWNSSVSECMKYENSDEHGFGRPYVWKEDGKYRMYYCVRTYSKGYYIGYAESLDGYSWNRLDKKAGIELSKSGWDSENMSYPYLFSWGNKTYMFYNGNGCGKTGFGYAELVER